jgi:hypothetical protein
MHLGDYWISSKSFDNLILSHLWIFFLDTFQLLPVGMLIGSCLSCVNSRHNLLRIVVSDQASEILLEETESIQIFRVHYIHSVITIEELNN